MLDPQGLFVCAKITIRLLLTESAKTTVNIIYSHFKFNIM